MTMATIHARRSPRTGRQNPARVRAGAYGPVLHGRRERNRSDLANNKRIAAAKIRKMAHARNPSFLDRWMRNLQLTNDEQQAERLAEEFHGRPARDYIDVEETEQYDEYGAVLGYLVELGILTEDGESEIPISFPYKPKQEQGNVLVVSNPDGTNIEFIGGDQRIDWRSVDGASLDDKYLVLVGPVWQISYWADKHHLAGPKSQKNGIEYMHEFGEDDDELPYLVYDRRNQKMLLVGGNYTIEPEGITG